jgi:hypothetical protein
MNIYIYISFDVRFDNLYFLELALMRILKNIVRILFINMKSKKKIKCISDNNLEIETTYSRKHNHLNLSQKNLKKPKG